ncbi:MAG: hypothetical protein K0Q49_820, partial [Haloplasmataceae bacterium]|nr:hypothetical protein [Haloplasmataceae bacterium]
NFSELLINYQTIGNKISTILNELNFISGKFDGLGIFFTPEIEQDKIVIKKQDNYSINIEYGLLPEKVNHMNYVDVMNLIKTITFKVLKTVYSNDNNKLEKITVAENDRRLEFTEGDKLVLLRQEENNIILKVSYDNSNHNTFLYYNDRLNKHEIERIYLDVFSLYELNLIEKIVIERDFIIFEPKDKSYYDQNAMINRFSIKYRLNNINFF